MKAFSCTSTPSFLLSYSLPSGGLGWVLFNRYCEVRLLSCRLYALDPEYRLLTAGYLLDHILQVFDRLNRLVVDFLDDETLRDAGLFQRTAVHLGYFQTVIDTELLLLGVGDRTEVAALYVNVCCTLDHLCVALRILEGDSLGDLLLVTQVGD